MYGENISFDASLFIYINSTNSPPIMIINRIYETQNLLSLLLISFLVGLRTYQHLCITYSGTVHNHGKNKFEYATIHSPPKRKKSVIKFLYSF
jgi:hypothetical protein